MKVKLRTNINPWNNEVIPDLELNTYYEVETVYINGWSTDVYLTGFDYPFNSVLFDDTFQEAWQEAINWFNKHPDDDHYGCFIKDYI